MRVSQRPRSAWLKPLAASYAELKHVKLLRHSFFAESIAVKGYRDACDGPIPYTTGSWEIISGTAVERVGEMAPRNGVLQ